MINNTLQRFKPDINTNKFKKIVRLYNCYILLQNQNSSMYNNLYFLIKQKLNKNIAELEGGVFIESALIISIIHTIINHIYYEIQKNIINYINKEIEQFRKKLINDGDIQILKKFITEIKITGDITESITESLTKSVTEFVNKSVTEIIKDKCSNLCDNLYPYSMQNNNLINDLEAAKELAQLQLQEQMQPISRLQPISSLQPISRLQELTQEQIQIENRLQLIQKEKLLLENKLFLTKEQINKESQKEKPELASRLPKIL